MFACPLQFGALGPTWWLARGMSASDGSDHCRKPSQSARFVEVSLTFSRRTVGKVEGAFPTLAVVDRLLAELPHRAVRISAVSHPDQRAAPSTGKNHRAPV